MPCTPSCRSEHDCVLTGEKLASGPVGRAEQAAVAPPNSLLELAATSAPVVIVQLFFGILVVYFFLAGWTKTRERTITNRSSFGGAMATARVLPAVVPAVSAYLAPITLIHPSLGVFLS